ncbi:MAG: exodeoxyribonuclease V subunit gamma [Actinobacteria bacterium]|nr:exodeoxyribonuclease V subunit gamma [Actinomycetota bacterium]
MLHVTVADRAEPLAERLADVLRAAPSDPMAPEWIATPSAGMRSWLWLELARHLGAGSPGRGDGVAANLTSAFPGTLRSKVLAAGRPGDDPDPWAVERLVWTVLAVLTDGFDPDVPDDDDPLVQRFGRERLGYGQARRIADLFDRYHLHRPQLVRRWAAGDDVDVLGNPLAAQHRWQPHVWRQVRERIGSPSPPELLPHLLREVEAGSLQLDLPDRLSLFGLPVLPGGSGFVDLATAVAVHRDVHLFLLDPSPACSDLVRADVASHERPSVRRRADDATADLIDHPLLRSWARLPRETAVLLADAEAAGFPEATRLRTADDGGASTLLGQVQADLRAGRAPAGAFARAEDDRSFQFHTAFGRRRQVDVARDAILHALADDPTLSEDDILVVCPSVEDMAPLIAAGFGPSAGRDPASGGVIPPTEPGAPPLRYRIVDRSIGRDNTVVAGLDLLLELLPGRFDAVAVQDLVAQPAVRERYRFSDDDLARIADWVDVASVRWGLDAEHRVPFGVPATVRTNTWGAALDRLLLGATLPDDDLAVTLGEVVPIGIEGDDVDLAGRLADLVHRLRELVDEVDDPRPLAGWLALFTRAVDTLLAPPFDDQRQGESVRRVLTQIAEQAADAPGVEELPLTFADVRRLLRERLADAPGRPPFFRGGVTVTSPESLRWVPHRVVVLLGMDQTAFTTPAGDGDDLAATTPLVGDREPRADRRLSLLETILSTGDRLVVIRDGRDLSTNREVPAAVVVAELLDTVGATLAGTDDPAKLETSHPRQAFDERNFVPGGLSVATAWSHDPTARLAAEARRHRQQEHLPFLAEPLPALDPDTFELSELIDAVCDPVSSFVRRRLQVQLSPAADAIPIQLPVDVVGLDKWKVGDRLLAAIRRGLDPQEWLLNEQRRGRLPSGALGDVSTSGIIAEIGVLSDAIERLHIGAVDLGATSIDLVLDDGTRVVGSVDHAFDEGPQGPAHIGFGRMKPRYRLAAWIELLALVATDPERPWRSVVLNQDKGKEQLVDLRPSGDDPAARRADALGGLAVALEVARRARCEPLPMFPNLTYAVHEADKVGKRALRKEWQGHQGWADGDKPIARLAFGDRDLDDLYAITRRDDDPFEDAGRLEGWARYVWQRYESTTVDAALLAAAEADA